MGPKPVQRHPPVWLGGGHPDALRRAAVIADGWMGAGGSSTAAFARVSRWYGQRWKQPGATRQHSPSPSGCSCPCTSVQRSPRLRYRWFSEVYHNPNLTTEGGVYGTPEQVREQLEELVAMGATHLLLNPITRYAEQVEHWPRWLAVALVVSSSEEG